jgi:Trk K+ transport system NAD-binding subunit
LSLPGKLVAGLTFASAAVFLTVFTAEVLGVIVELARRRGKLPLIDTGLGLKGHIIVCGWSDAGTPLVREINSEVFSHRHTTVIVSPDAGDISLQAVCPRRSFAPRAWAVEGDPTRPATLDGAYVRDAAVAVILTQDHGLQEHGERMSPADAKVMQVVLAVRSMAPDVPIIAELVEERHGAFAARLGASTFVSDETIVSRMIAQSVMKQVVSQIVFSMLTASKETCEPYFMDAPVTLVGLTFGAAYSRVAGHGLVLLAIERDRGNLLVNPPRDTLLDAGDKLVVLSRDEAAANRALRES